MSTATPNMGLIQSTIGVDSGLNWETNLNASLSTVDQHNHSTGSGVQITPSGIDINADLPFLGNNAISLRSVRFTPQGSTLSGALDLGCLYESGVDLYYNDGNGIPIPITKNGAVFASSSGIASGNASAAFSGSVLVVDGNTSTPGNIQAGSILIGNNTAGSNFVTLSAASGLAADISIVLPPSLPGSTSLLQLDSSGNITAFQPVSAVTFPGTIQIGGSSGPTLSYGSPGLSLSQQLNFVSGSNSVTIALSAANGILQLNGGLYFDNGPTLATFGGNTVKCYKDDSTSSGFPVVVSAAPSNNGLFIVRGFVDSSGDSPGSGTSFGEGWTATRSGTGEYVISFTTHFQDTPAVTVTVASLGASFYVWNIDAVSSSSVTILTAAASGGETNIGFHFIAIGQRNSSY